MLDTTIHMVSLDFVNGLPVMELANEYPLLIDDQETDLIASVEANGVREPLILFEDQLADGRNRLASANKVGLEVIPVRYFIGTIEEAEDLIIDLNEKRRHLLPVQRAYIADKHRAIVAKRAKERMLATQNNDSSESVRAALDAPSIAGPTQESGLTRTILARKHNAGEHSIDTVQKIRRVSEETMDDPDSDGVVMTPRAIKASAVLTKMQKGTITVSDAVKNVFGDPGQEINPDDQSKISTAKHGLGKIITELMKFDDFAKILMELGNETDQAFVGQKLFRANGILATSNEMYDQFGAGFDNLLDPDENREYWSDVESKNHE